jgi:hypothetical protein
VMGASFSNKRQTILPSEVSIVAYVPAGRLISLPLSKNVVHGLLPGLPSGSSRCFGS